jgi:hypothetical protein
VFTGPVTKEDPDNNTEAFVIWVTDNDPSLGGQDAFDVAAGGLPLPSCTEFSLDRFDDEEQQEDLYYVTSGDIVVQ